MHVVKIPILLGIALISGGLLISGAEVGVIGQEERPINPCQIRWDIRNREEAISNIMVMENGIRIKHRAGGVPPQEEDLEEVDKCLIIGDHIHHKGIKDGNHNHKVEE